MAAHWPGHLTSPLIGHATYSTPQLITQLLNASHLFLLSSSCVLLASINSLFLQSQARCLNHSHVKHLLSPLYPWNISICCCVKDIALSSIVVVVVIVKREINLCWTSCPLTESCTKFLQLLGYTGLHLASYLIALLTTALILWLNYHPKKRISDLSKPPKE